MGRSTSRLSRGLMGILAIILSLGLIFYIHNTSKSKAAEKAKPPWSAPGSGAKGETAKGAASGSEPLAPKTEISISSAPIAIASPADKSADKPGAGPGPATKPAALSAATPKSHAAMPPASANPLADAKIKFDAGDLLSARRILNAALIAGKLEGADATQAKATLNEINATVVFSPRRFADDEFGGSYNVQPGELMTKIAQQHDITWQYLCRANNLPDPKKLRAGATIKVAKGPFHALVEKKKFNMEIWVGGEPYSANASYVTSFPVGLGKDDSTPDGKWMIQSGNKIKNPTYYSPRGEGVIEAGDPKNPLGQYWLGLIGVDGHAVGKTSYGIHGTIDPTSIGKQESMGCIRMKNEDVAQVFELLVEGKSTVTVRE